MILPQRKVTPKNQIIDMILWSPDLCWQGKVIPKFSMILPQGKVMPIFPLSVREPQGGDDHGMSSLPSK